MLSITVCYSNLFFLVQIDKELATGEYFLKEKEKKHNKKAAKIVSSVEIKKNQ